MHGVSKGGFLMRHLFSKRRGAIAVGLLVLTSVAPYGAEAEDLQLPNLQALIPAEQVILGFADEFDINKPQQALRFTTGSNNTGSFALDVLGAPPIDATRTVANQCIAWTDRVCTARQEAGEFEFHPLHGHWHLNNFAQYDLRSLKGNGNPDMRDSGVVATGGKVSFCLMDYERQKPDDITDPYNTTGFYATCTGLLQGISTGWADLYTNDLAGQQILVDTVPDGDYALVVTVNPTTQLLETDYSDNTTYRKIRLGTTFAPGCVTTRTVTILS